MSNELKDILGNSNKDIDNQKLMDYLSQQLSKKEQHEVEQHMADDPFVNDAIEGLQELNDRQCLDDYMQQLGRDLKQQIAKSKKRKEKRRWKDNPQTYIAVITVLVLLTICYLALRKYFGG